MKVQFLGAAQTVTGSCYMIEANGKRFCVDCGMHQGNKAIEARNRDTKPYRPQDIDFILVTHAHIDHSGLLPKMVREGYAKPIYCTRATGELLELMLEDSAHIQEMEAQSEARKYLRRGLTNPPAALYATEDAQKAARFFQPVDYHKTFEPAPGIRVTYYDAGHILGSGSLRLEADENGRTTSMIFSGDIGRPQSLIVRNPEEPPQADYVFMESTYGDRDHKDEALSDAELAEAIAYSYGKGEKVIIPAFAVERTQEVLYCLHVLNKQGKLPADMPVFVDSPLAIRATEVFERHRDFLTTTPKRCSTTAIIPLPCPTCTTPFPPASRRPSTSTRARPSSFQPAACATRAACATTCATISGGPGPASSLWATRRGHPRSAACGKSKKNYPVRRRRGRGRAHFHHQRLFRPRRAEPAAGLAGPLVTGHCAKVVLTHGEIKAQTILAGLMEQKFGVRPLIAAYLEEMVLEGCDVATTVSHETQAHPRVDWNFLTSEVERKWGLFKGRLADVEGRPWLEQTDLQDAVEKLDYALTRLLSRM